MTISVLLIKAYITRVYGQADLESAFVKGYIMQVHTDEGYIIQAN